MRGVLESVVGIFHGDELDKVILGKAPHRLERDDLVLRAMEDEDVVGMLHVVYLLDIRGFKLGQELAAHLYLPVKADGHGLSPAKLVQLVVFHDGVREYLGHVDRGASKRDLLERAFVFGNVFQHEIAAEARRVCVDVIGVKLRFYIVRGKADIRHAVLQRKLLFHIVAMAGQVEGHDSDALIFGQHPVREFLRRAVVLMPGKAVDEQHRLFNTGAFAVIQLAADVLSAFIYLKILFHTLCLRNHISS